MPDALDCRWGAAMLAMSGAAYAAAPICDPVMLNIGIGCQWQALYRQTAASDAIGEKYLERKASAALAYPPLQPQRRAHHRSARLDRLRQLHQEPRATAAPAAASKREEPATMSSAGGHLPPPLHMVGDAGAASKIRAVDAEKAI
jgi:hypothetical protein